MHKILRRTHSENNIDLLKVRDYYFDKARILNNHYRKYCLFAPILLSVVGMIICSATNLWLKNYAVAVGITNFVDKWLDMVVGVVAIVSFIIDCFLVAAIDKNLVISNHFREQYDVEVLDIKPNIFLSKNISIAEHLPYANNVADSDKYYVWYREIFSKNDFYNVICVIMDNIIYTYHVYNANRKRLLRIVIVCFVFFFCYSLAFYFAQDDSVFRMVNPFLLFVAVFDEIKELVTSYASAKELAEDNKKIKEYIVENAEAIKETKKEEQAQFIRNLQDVVFFNRSKALFIPKSIRNKFLDNNCIFYLELDEVKSLFWGDEVSKPEKEEDFEIPVPKEKCKSREEFVTMKDLHDELQVMLEDVSQVLDAAGIEIYLDGGTLIGCERKNNHNSFLAWDDDIDISIQSGDVDKAKKIIRENLGEKYIIQDYYNEKYYSPRLATFRVRQKNNLSYISEKDSALYEKYLERGLFLDVYAYSPVLVSKLIDGWYRRVFIHPLHAKIKKVEKMWKVCKNKIRIERKFLWLKRKYMKRVEWYKKYAKCDKYYAYEPHYIENTDTPGPYLLKEELYNGVTHRCKFQGKDYPVPAKPERVLMAFYGHRWDKSPLVFIDELKKKEDNLYNSILLCELVDFMYKFLFVLPYVQIKKHYERKQNNNYEKYSAKIESLNKIIDNKDKWYIKRAKNKNKCGIRPKKLNKENIVLYYDRDVVFNPEMENLNVDFDKHMFSKSSFEATNYKHVKSVWINGKTYSC